MSFREAEMSSAAAETIEEAARTPFQTKARLALMMFLQYFVQGCYLPIVSVYLEEALGFGKQAIGVFGSALAIGPLVAPFVLGQLVDRRFATEKVLSFCHFCGGAVMLALYFSQQFWPVVVLGTLYSVLYVPSLMLTNSLAFHHLQGGDEEFPLVRVWGTIGFIVPAWLIEMVFLKGVEGEALNTGRGIALATAGVAGLIMAAYALFLPHTPPVREEKRRLAPVAAAKLVVLRPFLVLVAVTFFVSVVHKFFFVLNSPFLKDVLRAGGVTSAWEQRISSLGQIAEIGVMAVLAFFVRKLGFKKTMLLGLAAYAGRFVLFVLADQMQQEGQPFALSMSVVCLGQLLHGFCFGCFLAAAFMYLDRTTPKDVRGSVQNVYGTFVIGLGFFAGGFFSGWIGDLFTVGTGENAVENWSAIWGSGAAVAAACFVAFAAFFPAELPRLPDAEVTEETAGGGEPA